MPDSTLPIWRVPSGKTRHRRPLNRLGYPADTTLCEPHVIRRSWRQVAENCGRECRECARRAAEKENDQA